jgi:transcriptional regulator with XRE-family HTH domain
MDLGKYGKIIAEYRLLRGVTQKALAEKIGVIPSTISYWETGVKAPSLANRTAVAEALDIDFDLLVPELGGNLVVRTINHDEEVLVQVVDVMRRLPPPAQRAALLSLQMFANMVLVSAPGDTAVA